MSKTFSRKSRICFARTRRVIKKILVPLDGSKPADKALDFSLNLASQYSANIVLLSVVPTVFESMIPFTTAHHKTVLSKALKKAKKAKPKLKISTKLLKGRPSDRIVETARKGRFTLIVMGNRGLGGVKGFVLGSVSNRVVNEATRPVLIVK